MSHKTKKTFFIILIIVSIIILLPFLNARKNMICSVIMLDAIEDGNISKLEKALIIGNPNYVPGNVVLDAITQRPYRKSPLQLACYKGDIDMVKLLVENGADVNFVTNNARWSPLICAIDGQRENDFEIVKYLVENGADVNYSGTGGYSPVGKLIRTHTLSQNSIEILKFLISHETDLETINYLHHSCIWKHEEIIKYFIEDCTYAVEGGSVIQQYCRGVDNFSAEIFELLIQNGADIYETDEYGKCAVDYLVETTDGETYWVDVMKSIYEEYHS